jgi:hypothetical protein
LLLAPLALAGTIQGSDVFFRAADKSLVIRNVTAGTGNFSTSEAGPVRFSGQGNPVKLEMNNVGISISGTKVSGAAKPTGKSFFLEVASVSGSAMMASDTSVRESWQVEQGLLKAKSAEQTVTRVESDQIDYAGSMDEGVLTIPGKAVLHSATRGTTGAGQLHFEQLLDVHAVSAKITLDPSAKAGRANVRTADMPGPVTFTLKRTERKEGSTESTLTIYTGSADHVSADFTGANKTIVASGHVHITLEGGPTPGEAFAERATITVDENMKPIKFDLGGTL